MQIHVVYWSGTGNTEAMAKLIQSGAEGAGATVVCKPVASASAGDVNCDVLALGCPSMGAEMLEDSEFEPYIASIEGAVAGKKLALFGSYGWGDGQWMRDFDVDNQAVNRKHRSGLLHALEAPKGDSAAACVAFGKAIAQ